MKKKKPRLVGRDSPTQPVKDPVKINLLDDRVPKAYRLESKEESSDESSVEYALSDQEQNTGNVSNEDSGLDSDSETEQDKFENIQVSSLLSDMERLKEDLIKRNEYEKLKGKCQKSDSDDD